jgi:hypothetical protein
VVGGRGYNFDSGFWDYKTEARVYNKRDNRWRTLQPLANPISEGCLVTLGKAFKQLFLNVVCLFDLGFRFFLCISPWETGFVF